MHIGIDGIVLRGRDAGTFRYFEQLLRGLAQIDMQNEYIVFVRNVLLSQAIPSQTNFHLHRLTPTILPPALRQQFFCSWNVLGKLDLLHSIAFVPPKQPGCKTIATVPDLVFELHPELTKWTGRLWWKLFARESLRKASQIITHSHSTKSELCRYFGVPEEKIQVLNHYAKESFRPTLDRTIPRRYGLPDKYILYLGTLEPRKNVTTLIRAFALAKQRGALPHALVIAGQRGWLYQDIFRTVEQLELKAHVIFLGYVPDDDLPALYSGADLFAYLSWYEGFGLPVLEAMACGTPVLTSNVSALPEVVGDAGILVAPNNPEQAASEMLRVLTDTELRHELSARGLARAALFSQERFARGILQVYEEVLRA